MPQLFDAWRHSSSLITGATLQVDEIYHLACPASPVHYKYNAIKTIKVKYSIMAKAGSKCSSVLSPIRSEHEGTDTYLAGDFIFPMQFCASHMTSTRAPECVLTLFNPRLPNPPDECARHAQHAGACEADRGAVPIDIHQRGVRRPARASPDRRLLGQRQPHRHSLVLRRGYVGMATAGRAIVAIELAGCLTMCWTNQY